MALIRLEQIAAPLSLSGSGLVIEGDLTVISGSSTFHQQTSSIFYQSTSSIPAVTIYGDTVIHDQPGISSASLTIDNIDTLGDETTPQSVDLGTF
jgi:hypothetical protein